MRNYRRTVEYINSITTIKPKLAIILGSGLGQVSEAIDIKAKIPYEDIPGFIPPTVEGHSGNLIIGYIKGVPSVVMQGRNHFYEGHSMKEITFPIRIMKLLGAEILMTSNAVGGMMEDFEIGDIMLVTDHINLMSSNPLIGPNDDELGPRFPDMSDLYDKEIIKKAKMFSLSNNIKVYEGVLTALDGPCYETPAEYKWLRSIGADAVGMSTIPEVIVANHMGMKVFSLSLVTDLGVPGKIVKISHEDVQKAANEASTSMSKLLLGVIEQLEW